MHTFLFYSHFEELPSFPGNIIGWLASISTAIVVAYLAIFTNQKLDNILSWKNNFLLRFGLSTIVVLIMATAAMTFSAYIFFSIGRGLALEELVTEYEPELIKFLILVFFTSLVFEASYFGFFSYRQYAYVQIEKVTQERKQLRLQFEALKSQLSPHYLFNSLNTISSLVYKDPSSAEEFVRRLALTFQYVISTDHQKLVPLESEVEFIKSYYHLLKVRFGNSLNLDINLPENVLQTSIPPLTLQILIENAVKHNKFDSSQRLEIYVGTVDNQFLKVSNNKVAPAEDVSSFKVGLENIRKRYSFYSDAEIEVDDKDYFSVQLPVISLLKAG